MSAPSPDWFTAASHAAQRRDWAASMRIITLHHAEWPEEPAFLLTAAHWQRMAGYGDGANEALLRAAALEDSFGIAEEARILEITPQRPPLATTTSSVSAASTGTG
jgi:hypothetical protein